MPVINQVQTGNDYTVAATIADVWNSRGGWFSVVGASVDVQLQYDLAGGKQGRGQAEWLEAQTLGAGAFAYVPPNAIGVRFKSHQSGVPATVTAQVAQGPEPGLQVVAVGNVTVAGLALTFQHNDVAAGSEPIADFEDAAGVLTWTLFDDVPNTRMKITPAFTDPMVVPGELDLAAGKNIVWNGDTTIQRVAAGVVQIGKTGQGGRWAASQPAAGNLVWSSAVDGDTTSRLLIFASGQIFWGPGNAAADLAVARDAAGPPSSTGLALSTGQAFKVTSTVGFIYQGAINNQALASYFAAADSVPAFKIFSQGALAWGPGGGSALDLELARVANSPTGTGTFLELITGSGLGYGVGVGGAVTIVSGSSGILNKPTGQVTGSAAIATGGTGSYTVSNTVVGAQDTVVVNLVTGGGNIQRAFVTAVAAGSFTIFYENSSGVSQTPKFNFAVIKGSTT